MTTPADILDGAALYLERHGWMQGTYHDDITPETPFPPACLYGAIIAAIYGRPGTTLYTDDTPIDDVGRCLSAVQVMDETIARRVGYAILPEIWNDQPDRTATDVITVLREAATEWRQEHGDPS